MTEILWIILLGAGTVIILFGIGSMDSDWSLRLTLDERIRLGIIGMVIAVDIVRRTEWTLSARYMFSVLAGCLVAACVMDLWERMVYRFVWWTGGVAAALLFLSETGGCGRRLTALVPLVLFAALQYGIFGRMYGRADCDAFCVCAIAFTALGLEFRDYVMHMAITFGMVALVQAFKKNIAVDGNLKKPVPLVPYISAAFWFWVDFMA